MKRKVNRFTVSLILIFLFSSFALHAQSLPAGSAGMVYTYNAAGNRTKVEYVLNNTTVTASLVSADTQTVAKKIKTEILQVDALYPNPTTGRITVRLAKPLQNAIVLIMDVVGRTVLKKKESGSLLNFDLSSQPTGVYILHIDQGAQEVTMKIIKR